MPAINRHCQLLLLLPLCLLLPLPQAIAGQCVLTPMAEHLQIAALRTDEWHPDESEYAEKVYRRRLMRFVNSYYSDIADDLLRGEGDYLAALEHLMGSDSADCVALYKHLLVQEVNSQDFAFALWTLRVQPVLSVQPEVSAQTSAAPDCKHCEVSEIRSQ
jgi:hypothetical protein